MSLCEKIEKIYLKYPFPLNLALGSEMQFMKKCKKGITILSICQICQMLESSPLNTQHPLLLWEKSLTVLVQEHLYVGRSAGNLMSPFVETEYNLMSLYVETVDKLVFLYVVIGNTHLFLSVEKTGWTFDG